jgi:hypothetical protein
MKMTQPENPMNNLDDQLADFTDRVMDGKTALLASSSDDDLRGIEETVMRLNRAFPQEKLDERTIRRMQADFKTRVRKSNSTSRPIWQSRQFRQRFTLAFAAITILAAIFIITPFITAGTGNIQGTAGEHPGNIALLAILGCVFILILWLGRRK